MKKTLGMLLLAMLLMLCAGAQAEGSDNWLDGFLSGVTTPFEQELDFGALSGDRSAKAKKENRYLATLLIDGELMEGDVYYDHAGTLDAIDALRDDARNAALLVIFNTPGGGLYESDELYHALSVYKQATGRPVYAYMKQQCCSGGVYAAMAADTIYAARMTITGSVGVYMQSISEAGLLEKLGIEQTYISTGDNKVSGYPTLTESQRAIDQAMVDEGFEFFKGVIGEGRGLTDEQMAPFLDGRILTALQAKEFGLIDDVLFYDEAMERIVKELGGEVSIRDITPEMEMGFEALFGSGILDFIMP